MKQTKETSQLTSKECTSAIEKWVLAKTEYSEIKKYIDTRNVFCFNKENLTWIESFKDQNHFYMFAGIHNEEFIFILSPLDSDGNIKSLESYHYITPMALDQNLEIYETINIEKTTTLTQDYILLENTSQTINLDHTKDTSINKETAFTRIQSWLNEGMDWFYYEDTEFNGERIFNSFKVPSFDIELNPNIQKAYCLFGLKKSDIHNMLIPVLNFISVTETTKADLSTKSSNIGDFSSPCPPFCRDKKVFPETI